MDHYAREVIKNITSLQIILIKGMIKSRGWCGNSSQEWSKIDILNRGLNDVRERKGIISTEKKREGKYNKENC